MQEARQRLDRILVTYKYVSLQVEEEKAALAGSESLLGHALEAQKLLQGVAESVQRIAHERIAGIVSRCLQAVFPDDGFEFKTEFRQSRGKTEARFLFVRNGKEESPLEASCGGAVDVAAFALRLASLVLSRPKKRLFLTLDEPFRFVHGEGNRERLVELVKALADETGVQFLIVTGFEWMKVGKVVEI